LGGDSIGHCEKKKVYTNVCLILSGPRDRAILTCLYKSVRFLFVGLDEEQKFTKERWIQQTNCWLTFWMVLAA